MAEFLARIKAALEGKEKVVDGLQEIQGAAKQLSKTKITTIFNKTGLIKGAKTVQEFADGSKLLTTFNKEGLVTGSKLTQSFDATGNAITKAGKGTNDFVNAMRRALIVAPVWMALRATMQFFIQGIQQGIDYSIKFESQMLLLKQSLQGLGVGTDVINNLRDQFFKLSQETGKPAADIVKSYTTLIKGGADLKTAMTGAIAVTKLSEVSQEDATEMAKTFAVAMKLQGDTFDSTASAADKYNQIAANLFVLGKNNLTTVGELSKEYTNFASSANTANLTFNQTIALLATLNSAGVQNVQGLRTGLLRLLSEIDKLAPRLGIAVNPENTKPFEVLMAVLTKIRELSRTTGFSPEKFAVLKDLFGAGGRGGTLPIAALSEVLDKLKSNLSSIAFPTESAKQFNQALEDTNNSLPQQIEELENLKKQAFESFIMGITGGKDFNESLKMLGTTLRDQVIPGAELLGETLRNSLMAFGTLGIGNILSAIYDNTKKTAMEQSKLQEQIMAAYKGQLEYGQLLGLISNVEKNYTDTTLIGRQRILDILRTTGVYLSLNKTLTESTAVVDQAQIDKATEMNSKVKALSSQLQDKLLLSQQDFAIIKLQAAGATNIAVEYKKLDNIVEVLVNRYNSLTDTGGKQIAQISEQSVKVAILSGDFNKMLNIFKDMALSEKEITAITSVYAGINKSILSDLNKRFSQMSTILGIQGEQQSTMVKEEMTLKSLIFGEDYLKNSMDDRLKLAQALTKEADEQEKRSTHLVDLYKISKKYGQETAQEISKYLGGLEKFADLSYGAQRAIKKVMPGEAEAGTAEQYFVNKGFQFPEEIEKQRKQQRNINILNEVMVQPIELSVNLQSEDVIRKVKDAINAELDDKKSELYGKIQSQIEEF